MRYYEAKLDGFTAIKQIRSISSVWLMLSTRGKEYNKLFGFELGIDDYFVKPFSPKKLIARIAAVVARSKQAHQIHKKLEFWGLIIDLTGREPSL